MENRENWIMMDRFFMFGVCFCLGIVALVMVNRVKMSYGLDGRIDLLRKESKVLVDKVLVMELEMLERDSMIMREVGVSEGKIMEYVRLRSESWDRAEALADSIDVMRKERERLINRDLKW